MARGDKPTPGRPGPDGWPPALTEECLLGQLNVVKAGS